MSQNHNQYLSIRLPLIISIALAIGVIIGMQIAPYKSSAPIEKFINIFNYIQTDYVDSVNEEVLIEKAIKGMLEVLDPHSNYVSVKENAIIGSQLKGKFDGIGIEFKIFKDTINVIIPLIGGPSEKAGLLSGDKIIKIDDEIVAGVGFNNNDVISVLRGKKGSKVLVSIIRNGQSDLLRFEIKRGTIPQYALDVSYMINDSTGYVKLNRFSSTSYDEFKEVLKERLEDGMENLILDLTGNPGGYMDRAINLIDELLPKDKLIVYTKGNQSGYNERYDSKRGGYFEGGQLIVLIDEFSASASEIVAGAIQDHDRGTVIGRRSYGKGLVQLPIDLRDGSELRLTISRYYTPSGRSIQRPYNLDNDDYHADYLGRFENGEIYDKEYIQPVDRPAFETSGGRKVYGGGGIVPDILVPFDTIGKSKYFFGLINSNSISEYSSNYVKGNKKVLEEIGMKSFIDDFMVTPKMLTELIRVGTSNDLIFDEKGFNDAKDRISNLLKASIARQVWDNEGFFPIYNQNNEIYKEAVRFIMKK